MKVANAPWDSRHDSAVVSQPPIARTMGEPPKRGLAVACLRPIFFADHNTNPDRKSNTLRPDPAWLPASCTGPVCGCLVQFDLADKRGTSCLNKHAECRHARRRLPNLR